MKRALLFVAAITGLGLALQAGETQTLNVPPGGTPIEGTPGRVWTDQGTMKAKVTAIDRKTREITLQGPEGDSVIVEAGPEVKNFDQIQKGDTVVANYTEATALFVRKPGDKPEQPSAAAAVAVQRAAPGEKPSATLAGTAEITATVKEINYKKRTVVLVGPEGNKRTVKVPPEVTRFDEVKKGDTIVAQVTKSIALSVEKSK